MGKQTPSRSSKRSEPYPPPRTRQEMSTVSMNLSHATNPTACHPLTWPLAPTTRSMPPPAIGQYHQRHQPADRTKHASLTLPATNPSSPWSTEDDETLLEARSRSLGWNQIQRDNFPFKTPNACRKRYERLIAKRRNSEWDGERAERVMSGYMRLRQQIWRPLAEAVDENWQDVEKFVSTPEWFLYFLVSAILAFPSLSVTAVFSSVSLWVCAGLI